MYSVQVEQATCSCLLIKYELYAALNVEHGGNIVGTSILKYTQMHQQNLIIIIVKSNNYNLYNDSEFKSKFQWCILCASSGKAGASTLQHHHSVIPPSVAAITAVNAMGLRGWIPSFHSSFKNVLYINLAGCSAKRMCCIFRDDVLRVTMDVVYNQMTVMDSITVVRAVRVGWIADKREKQNQ